MTAPLRPRSAGIALYTFPSPDPTSLAELTAAGFLVASTCGGSSFKHPPSANADVRVLLIGMETITASHLDSYPNLELLALSSAGVDHVDVSAARARGIRVTNVPNQAREEVATHALALTLALLRNLSVYNRSMRAGNWRPAETPPVWPRASTLTMGVVGLGAIGRTVAKYSAAIFKEVVGFDPAVSVRNDSSLRQVQSLGEVITHSDILSLHLPLLPSTRGLLDAGLLREPGRGRMLINVSRGGLISNEEVLSLLNDGSLAGVGLDVFPEEPPRLDDPLFCHNRVIVTPHRAFESQETLDSYTRIPIQNAVAWAGGKPLISEVTT